MVDLCFSPLSGVAEASFIILIITPTEMGKSLLNFCVVQVVSGPVLARETTPDRVVVVDSDRVGEAVFTLSLPLSTIRSKPYSGACTPITARSSFSYFYASH